MAKLFSSKDIELPKEQIHKEAESQETYGDSILAISESLESMRTFIGNLRQGQIIKYWTNGAWSMHELLEYILQQTGPANVFISTWTITENPARVLHNLVQSGLITNLKCLLDHRIKTRAPHALQLLAGTAHDMAFAKCHAKVTTIENDQWGISIVASANYSRNPRLEAGTIFTNKIDAIFDRKIMQKELDDAKHRTT